MKKIYKDIAVFVGGTLFGSAGIKLLSSKDAKNVYTHAAAAVLRMKDTVMNTVDCVKENARRHPRFCRGDQREARC